MITSDSVFIQQGYIQHASAEWRDKQYFPYHVYSISNDVHMLVAVSLAYRTCHFMVAEREKEDKAVKKEVAAHKIVLVVTKFILLPVLMSTNLQLVAIKKLNKLISNKILLLIVLPITHSHCETSSSLQFIFIAVGIARNIAVVNFFYYVTSDRFGKSCSKNYSLQ